MLRWHVGVVPRDVVPAEVVRQDEEDVGLPGQGGLAGCHQVHKEEGVMAARSPGVTGKCYCHCLGDIIMLTKTVLNQSLETEGLGARLNAEKKEQKRR